MTRQRTGCDWRLCLSRMERNSAVVEALMSRCCTCALGHMSSYVVTGISSSEPSNRCGKFRRLAEKRRRQRLHPKAWSCRCAARSQCRRAGCRHSRRSCLRGERLRENPSSPQAFSAPDARARPARRACTATCRDATSPRSSHRDACADSTSLPDSTIRRQTLPKNSAPWRLDSYTLTKKLPPKPLWRSCSSWKPMPNSPSTQRPQMRASASWLLPTSTSTVKMNRGATVLICPPRRSTALHAA